MKWKKFYLIHGWGGSSKGDWFVWVKKRLEEKGFKVEVPDMPNTLNPNIKMWVGKLKQIVKNADEDTYFIGHSIGCQAIMRYLESLEEKIKVGGVIFVAGWLNLTNETWDSTYTKEIANEWLNNPINFAKIKNHSKKFILIASDNDPYVPLSDTELFRKNLGAEIIVLKNKGHISGEDGVKEFPLLLDKILEMAKCQM